MESAANPFQVANEWIEKNSDSSQKEDGVQMVLSTVGKRGYPASRVVRLRVSPHNKLNLSLALLGNQ